MSQGGRTTDVIGFGDRDKRHGPRRAITTKASCTGDAGKDEGIGIGIKGGCTAMLLTLGPQMRGSENTRLGQGATRVVHGLMRQLVSDHIAAETERTIPAQNDSGRTVQIIFAHDPDVRITETLRSEERPLVSIEVKVGTDVSNIHNRLGEAEKSHLKAKKAGFFEFWIIIRVDVDERIARSESPTTSRFFHLDRIADSCTREHGLFSDLLGSTVGVRLQG